MTPKRVNTDAPLSHCDEDIRKPAPEFHFHSFIVKVWLEEAATRTKASRWRGRITHVPDGEKRYLQDLKEVAAFITPYLRAMGVRPRRWDRIKRWLLR